MQIGVNTRGINPFMAKTKRAQQMLKTAPQEYVRKRVFAVYKFVIDATPQYSGALVDSWSLRTNLTSPGASAKVPSDWEKIDPVDTPGEFEANKKQAIAKARAQVATLKYNSKIQLVNTHYAAMALSLGARPRGDLEPLSWRDINHAQVRQADEILTASWNIRSVTLAKFQYLKFYGESP